MQQTGQTRVNVDHIGSLKVPIPKNLGQQSMIVVLQLMPGSINSLSRPRVKGGKNGQIIFSAYPVKPGSVSVNRNIIFTTGGVKPPGRVYSMRDTVFLGKAPNRRGFKVWLAADVENELQERAPESERLMPI